VGEVDCREGGNLATIHVAPRLMLATRINVETSPAQKFAVFSFVGIDCNCLSPSWAECSTVFQASLDN
jgi:hypothetical protein